MAKLPSTLYKQILDLQKELYEQGLTNGSLCLGDVYAIFYDAGYKRTTANKWLLNWAVTRQLMFEKDGKEGEYRVRLGDYRDKSLDYCTDNQRVWLPVKEVVTTEGRRSNKCVL